VIDLDGTLCPVKTEDQSYEELLPDIEVIKKIKKYKASGFYIILYTSRQMRTYDGNLGRINANTAKMTLDWLEKNQIPYDEIYFGKPWCGYGGFYVDDKTIRPDEFIKLSYKEIIEKIK
jgi:capsule biosynthesis phosphatase